MKKTKRTLAAFLSGLIAASSIFAVSAVPAGAEKSKTAAEIAADTSSEYTWKVQPTIAADDIAVLDHTVPILSEDGKTRDRSTTRSTLYCDFAPIKKNGKWGLISYDGEMALDIGADAIGISDDQKWFANVDLDAMKVDMYAINGEKANELTPGENVDPADIWYYNDKYPASVKQWSNYLLWVDETESLYEELGQGMSVRADEKHTFAAHLGEFAGMSDEPSFVYGDDNYSVVYVLVSNGKRVNSETYENAGCFSDGIIPLEKNGKWGYVNALGETVIPFEYDDAYSRFSTETAAITYMTNNRVAYNSSNGYVVLCKDNQYALYTSDNKCVIDFGELEAIRPVYEGMAWAKKDGKWGVIQLSSSDSDTDLETDSDVTSDTDTDSDTDSDVPGDTDTDSDDDITPADITGDGRVTVEDATLALKAAVNITQLSDGQIKAADMDGNGRITVSDANIIQKKALKII